jgi:RecB family exonuclease
MVIYSYSRISTFEQCPLKFKLKYIDKLPPDIKEFIEGFLGRKVHESLEWLYNNVNNGIIPSLDELLEYYINSWNNEFKEEIKIVKNSENSENYFNKGIKILIDYFLKHRPFKENTIAIEKKIMLNLDKNGIYKLQGYIDRLVYNKEDKIYEIHDYKTSDSMKTREDLLKDKQLALYSIGVKELFCDAEEINLIWHFLSFNEKIVLKTTNEKLQDLKKEVINLIEKIESTEEFKPNPSSLCGWCEFRSYCPIC